MASLLGDTGDILGTIAFVFVVIGIAALGTLIEAASPAGTDNLTAPIFSFLVALLAF